MALDQAYFDSIRLEVIKKKYYSASRVEAVLADIRQQARALQAENEELRRRLAEKDDPNNDLTEAIFSAQSVYRTIVERARRRADEILLAAERQRAVLQDDNQLQREYSVQAVEQCLQRVRDQQQSVMDTINSAWQEFLCGLYPEDSPPDRPLETAADIPPDLGEKVDAIARELFSIDEQEADTE